MAASVKLLPSKVHGLVGDRMAVDLNQLDRQTSTGIRSVSGLFGTTTTRRDGMHHPYYVRGQVVVRGGKTNRHRSSFPDRRATVTTRPIGPRPALNPGTKCISTNSGDMVIEPAHRFQHTTCFLAPRRDAYQCCSLMSRFRPGPPP
jgi:hypothetical protein